MYTSDHSEGPGRFGPARERVPDAECCINLHLPNHPPPDPT